MIVIDDAGVVRDSRVKIQLIPAIAHGPLLHIDAIVVHQTASATAKGTLASYRTSRMGNGAHFLIDKDGTLYQTVSIKQKCWHVGPILSRCYEKHSCVPEEEKKYSQIQKTGPYHRFVTEVSRLEMQKQYPARFPSNSDSLGIENVGIALADGVHFEPLTDQQQRVLGWLIQQLLETLHLKRGDIYRHPEISRKTAGEAASARW